MEMGGELSIERAQRGPTLAGALRSPASGTAAAALFLAALLAVRLNTDLFLTQPVAIKLHVVAAVTSVGVGAVLMAGAKGRALHRTLGWLWVGAMAITAVSSLFIREVNHGQFSFIHAISGWVIMVLPLGVWRAKRRNIKAHRGTMRGLFYGGSVLAGALAFVPGRLMWQLVFG